MLSFPSSAHIAIFFAIVAIFAIFAIIAVAKFQPPDCCGSSSDNAYQPPAENNDRLSPHDPDSPITSSWLHQTDPRIKDPRQNLATPGARSQTTRGRQLSIQPAALCTSLPSSSRDHEPLCIELAEPDAVVTPTFMHSILLSLLCNPRRLAIQSIYRPLSSSLPTPPSSALPAPAPTLQLSVSPPLLTSLRPRVALSVQEAP